MNKDFYTISDLIMISGLSDRSIRNHLASGLLKGDNSSGKWQFSADDVAAWVDHPSVRPSILAKRNALVYDFMADGRKKESRICIVLDLPGEGIRAMNYFCKSISEGDFSNIRFNFDGQFGMSRVMLEGDVGQVLSLVNGYYAK